MALQINPFFHAETSTWTYLVVDSKQKLACIIDSVLDFDLPSGQYSFQSADALIEIIQQQQLELVWICETHAHADHLTAASYIKSKLGGKTVIGHGITQVQKHFSAVFNMPIETDGTQFDRLVANDDCLSFGDFAIKVLSTPGHTPDSITYQIEDNFFVGDTFFHPSIGTARCDFPGGDAEQLFSSLQKILAHQASSKIWLCHDYPGTERKAIPCVQISEQQENIHLVAAQHSASQYQNIRNSRDAQLAVPKLLYPSLQVNICAGQLPSANSNGANYLKIPLSEKK